MWLTIISLQVIRHQQVQVLKSGEVLISWVSAACAGCIRCSWILTLSSFSWIVSLARWTSPARLRAQPSLITSMTIWRATIKSTYLHVYRYIYAVPGPCFLQSLWLVERTAKQGSSSQKWPLLHKLTHFFKATSDHRLWRLDNICRWSW